jgi:peptidoglycan hydrolase-like protein with peptidoglycan-binding domain
MVRRPGEIDPDDETRLVTPRPPRPPSDADTQEPAGPVVTCRSCGATNPEGRTLCERCGMGLMTADDVAERDGLRLPAGAGRILVLSLLVVIGAVVGWLLLRDRGVSDTTPSGVAAGTATSEPAATSAASAAATIELGPGDNGPPVRAWQQALRDAGFEVVPDGIYGPGTEEATRRFQASTGEEPTGRVTSRTLAAGRHASSLRPVGVFLLRDGELQRARRLVDETQLARGALEALVAAPLASERDEGLATAIPRDVTVDAVAVEEGTATVRMRGFAADTGAGNLQARVDQVVRTLTRFDSIDDVRFVLPADDMTVFADAGVSLDRPRGTGDG